MRIPNSAHQSRPWRIHAIVPDFTLEDVWALPAEGGAGDFQSLLDLLATSDPASADSLPTRVLWRIRDGLGRVFDLGRVSTPSGGGLAIPGSDEISLAERLPDDLRDTAGDVRFGSLPFVPLYRTRDEFAAEISNPTVHGVVHLAWAERDAGDYRAEMAVYVKPRGALGRGYMALIKPFRYWIVYPALLRQVERTWNGRNG
jgi:Protein of unknown function (DUF2867)